MFKQVNLKRKWAFRIVNAFWTIGLAHEYYANVYVVYTGHIHREIDEKF